jgi:Fur family iron response transcriptional regulator
MNHCLLPAEIEKRLRVAGVRPTSQRIAVARFVLCEADHPSAEQVKAWADENFHKMSLATVYNTLGALVRAGLLKEVRLPHSERTVYDDNVSDHYHFLDEATGTLHDVDPSEVELTPRLKPGMTVRGVEVLLRGTLRKPKRAAKI